MDSHKDKHTYGLQTYERMCNLVVGIFLQCIKTSNHHNVHLNLIGYCISITLQLRNNKKREKEIKTICRYHFFTYETGKYQEIGKAVGK